MAAYSGRQEGEGARAAEGQGLRQAADGLRVRRHFSTEGVDPFEEVTWEKRPAAIQDEKGQTIFRQDDVEVPSSWSQLATNVVASKYFYGPNGTRERERSARQLIQRVTRTITDWARSDGAFASEDDAEAFYGELTWLCLNQCGAFNSPVWFNVGLFHHNGIDGSEGNYHWDPVAHAPVRTRRGYEHPQASACFIQSVDDTMEDIMRLARSEAMLFKYGSGTGTDLSTLRSSREQLSGGGRPSGPLSFMRVFDQIAAVVKSGGKTRRAAKMQSLRCDHPDILEFIECKAREEKKARALIQAGYDGSFNGDAYASVMYQNSNLSVRLTEEFLQAAVEGRSWQTYAVTTRQPLEAYPAAELLRKIAEGTHLCGDPGIQYDTTINNSHTCPDSGPINASNPCSEFMFLDDSACNLASLNLMKFRRDDGSFDVASFRQAVRVFIIAQETLVDHGSYPTKRICRNSHDFRPLGLGYANLGALLMSLGLPYDSDGGRAVAASITALMTGEAYATSAELASRLGCFPEYHRNRRPMLKVMRMHRQAVDGVRVDDYSRRLVQAAAAVSEEAIAAGELHGYRNAQATVLAPTGTIGFMMDCDTTGIEPDIALVKYKLLAGGGLFKLVNRTVPLALERLGYSQDEITQIIQHIEERDTIEGAAGLRDEHLPVFDCAFKPENGVRSISHTGHLRMMAAAQPFLSGAISKTVNMPKESTVEEIEQTYLAGWRMGLKAVAIYRDGSKVSQPLNLKREGEAAQPEAPAEEPAPVKPAPRRKRMPVTSTSVRHKFEVGGHEGYIHAGLFEDGTPGELFITMAKEGSTVGGMMDAFATAISLCLQYGVPLEALVKKFSHQRFEPAGMTSDPDIPFAKSIVDYIFRWLGMRFLSDPQNTAVGRPGQVREPTFRAAGEAVKDDISSSSRGAGRIADKDAAIPGAGVAAPPGDDGGNGDGAKGGGQGDPARAPLATAAPPRLEERALLLPDRIDRQFSHFQEDAPPCDVCGAITVRNGNCYRCYSCGSSMGCS